MDLSTITVQKSSEEGAWVDIYAPDGTKTDIRIKVAGKDSSAFKAKVQKLAQLERKKKNLSVPEIEKYVLDAYVIATLDWENVCLNDKEIPCERENIIQIYNDYAWIYEQVTDFISERANFLGT